MADTGDFNVERILSYIAALMGVIARRANSLDDAVTWAQRSVRHNPRQLGDRDYNLACVLALRGKDDDRKRAIDIVKNGLAKGTITSDEARTEDDFSSIRDELGLPPAPAGSPASAAPANGQASAGSAAPAPPPMPPV